MDEIIFEIIRGVLIVGIMVVLRYIVPFIKSRINDSDLDLIYKWSVRAVEAAEQTISGKKKGFEKKEVVKDFIKKLVDEKDLGLTDAQIENLIESAVYALKQGGSHDERTKSIH